MQHQHSVRCFDELLAEIPAVVDVLTEVSERRALASNSDVRLYERWR